MRSNVKTLLWVAGAVGATGIIAYLATRSSSTSGGGASASPGRGITPSYNPNAANIMSAANTGFDLQSPVGSSVRITGPSGETLISSMSSNPTVLAPAPGTTDGFVALAAGTAVVTGLYQSHSQVIPQVTVVAVTIV